ncbi:MAG: lipocalin family protein, partial [Sphingobacterium sp.]
WSIYKPENGGESQFQFKKLYPGEKAKNITEGYRLDLAYADEQTLTLHMPVNVDGGNDSFLEFKFSKR